MQNGRVVSGLPLEFLVLLFALSKHKCKVHQEFDVDRERNGVMRSSKMFNQNVNLISFRKNIVEPNFWILIEL